MSRYTKQKNNLTLNYGFDHALGYWYDIIDQSQTDEQGNPKLLEEKSTNIDGLKRGNFLEILINFDADKAHQFQVALDLTF